MIRFDSSPNRFKVSCVIMADELKIIGQEL